jgi:hypothetical protein
LLNRSLPDDLRAPLEDHLERCPACRRELAETRHALEVFSAHVATDRLVDYSAGRLVEAERELVERHLARCQSCAEELSLLDAGRKSLAADTPAPSLPQAPVLRPASPPLWRWGTLAASLLAAAALTGWSLTWLSTERAGSTLAADRAELARRIADLEGEQHRLLTEQVGPATQRAAELERELAGLTAELQELRRGSSGADRIARLQEENQRLRQPRGNALINLLPQDLVARGGPAAAPPATAGRGTVVLLNGALDPGAPAEPYRLEVRDPNGRLLTQIEGLEPDDAGTVAVTFPPGSLPTGALTLALFPSGGDEPVVYRFEVH